MAGMTLQSFDVRDRYNPEESACGVGGAGLFSDGKFSFFPSSTDLWKLPKKELLLQSLDWVLDILPLPCKVKK